MQTDDAPRSPRRRPTSRCCGSTATSCSRSRVGLHRHQPARPTATPRRDNFADGVDAQINVSADLQIAGYWARTRTDGADGDDASYRGRVRLERRPLRPSSRAPVRRRGLQSGGRLPAPHRLPPLVRPGPLQPATDGFLGVRKFYSRPAPTTSPAPPAASQSEEYQGQFNTEFNSGDLWNIDVTRSFEAIVTPFEVARGVSVPAGEYWFTQGKATYPMGLQRRISGAITARLQRLLRRHADRAHLARPGRVHAAVLRRADAVVEPRRRAVRQRQRQPGWHPATYTVSPRMFVSALVQYHVAHRVDVHQRPLPLGVSAGQRAVRRLQRRPHDPRPGLPELQSRSFVVKMTKLFRW